jgi:ribonuclease HI
VPAHSGIADNERVDRLANEAIDALPARAMR